METDRRHITDIQIQEKRKDRVSVFIDGEFAFGLHQDVLLKSGIAKGDALSDEEIAEIRDMESRRAAKEKAMRLLAHRARSQKELRERLLRSGFEEAHIDWTLAELHRLNLLDDGEFAKMFARDRMLTKPVGEFLLRQELRQKGIQEADIEKAVQEAYAETSEYDYARQLAVKQKAKQLKLDPEKAQKRVADFLMRRGFHWDITKDIMEHWDSLQ